MGINGMSNFQFSVVCFALMLAALGPSTSVSFAQEVAVTSLPVSGREITPEQILPADVLARTHLIQDEIALIRAHMGRSDVAVLDVHIAGATPREVFFQALSLYQKVTRLQFEHLREISPTREIESGEMIRPWHVWHRVDDSLAVVLKIKEKLGITTQAEEKVQDISTVPSQVFLMLLKTNRDINDLLTEKISPSHVFMQVTLALSYATRLRQAFPQPRMPDVPGFEPDKRPSDVYRRLLICFKETQEIMSSSNLESVTFEISDESLEAVVPNDVYNLASLLVSQLSFLHSQLQNAPPALGVYYPGPKTPSDVYQRAGILEIQLNEILTLVHKQPDWLRGRPR